MGNMGGAGVFWRKDAAREKGVQEREVRGAETKCCRLHKTPTQV